jgi:hypothetical protein
MLKLLAISPLKHPITEARVTKSIFKNLSPSNVRNGNDHKEQNENSFHEWYKNQYEVVVS